ncbi:hypothetical protein BJY17_001273 [Agromyces hippuratus]|uniref:Glycosyltransferase RgtA/B/C/D-like domain-containing protein n=1 Tax=Agromyces hippuratus TaxID=286438 RepID=A0A852WRF5_9MICO|nr:hypothetical protein [Agromyces hippuratus]NYG20526.1 hypothetical protein [Agromyces hippuratus]
MTESTRTGAPSSSFRIWSTRVIVWLSVNDRWAHVVLFAVFAVLVLTGTTTSNLTQDYLQQTVGGREGILGGNAQEIRWDEYLGGTPTFLSIMSTNGLPSFPPLAEQAGLAMRYSEGGPIGALVFFDGTLLRLSGIIPDAILFSLHWWLPTILFLACMPIWFRQLGFGSRLGWLAGLLIAASPAVAWWSLQPVNVMGFTLAGCVALIAGYRRIAAGRIWRALPFGILAAILLAGIPSAYLLWSLLLGVPLLIMSALLILMDREAGAKLRWGYLVGVGLLTILLVIGMLADVRDGLVAMGNTLYPGDRRLPSTPTIFEMLFGAPSALAVDRGALTSYGGVTNKSELAVSWTVAFVMIALLVTGAFVRLVKREWRLWLPVGILFGWGLVWLAWASLAFGEASARLPIFSQVPSQRAAQVVGIIGVLVLCLMLSRIRTSTSRAAGIAVVVAAIGLYAGSLLQRFLIPDMSTTAVWIAGILSGAAAFLMVRWGDRVWAIAVVALLAGAVSATVNPITVGLGGYRDSDPARYFAAASDDVRAAGEVWASDFRAMDAIMLANGLPSLSGPQPSGPRAEQWERLDPEGSAEAAWNRGGSRIRIVWTEEPGVQIESTSYNVVTITANPCSLHESYPELTTVMSRDELPQSCLVERDVIQWKDTPVHVYEFDDAE